MPKKTMFQKYLMESKGDRSFNKFAQDAGVDTSYLTKLFKNDDMSYPSPDFLSKLAKVAQNNVTYEDFMEVCEYIPKRNITVDKKFIEMIKNKYIGLKAKLVMNSTLTNFYVVKNFTEIIHKEDTKEITLLFEDASINCKFEDIIYLDEKDTICFGNRNKHVVIYFLGIDNKENIN